MNLNTKKLVSLGAIAYYVFWVSFAYAQPTGTPVTLTEIEVRISQIAQFMIRVGAVLMVVFIIWAGITYMSAGADPTAVNKGRQRLLTAILGSLIILGVGVIIETVAGVATREVFCTVSLGGVCLVP